MYSLLIVDDEALAIKAVRSMADWEALGILPPLEARSLRQAEAVLEEVRIDILLCDVEMPRGDGLELARRVRERYPEMEIAFLSCHADFAYVRRALQLGSVDYLLKPATPGQIGELLRGIVDRLEARRPAAQASGAAVERFWHDLLWQAIASDERSIGAAAMERGVELVEGRSYRLVMAGIHRWAKGLEQAELPRFEQAIRAEAREMILKEGREGVIADQESRGLLFVLPAELVSDEELEADCAAYAAACRERHYCRLTAYLAQPASIEELVFRFSSLIRASAGNVDSELLVLRARDQGLKAPASRLPDTRSWALMLGAGEVEALVREVEAFLLDQRQRGAIDPVYLRRFHQDFLQLVYSAIDARGIQAHRLLEDEETTELATHAWRSVEEMLEWVRVVAARAGAALRDAAGISSPVDRAKLFIRGNAARELAREDIAAAVGMNPDYLTRIFKKETGKSLMEYLTEERLGLAEELVAKSEMPIGEIASELGYSNFSHFSKIFKERFGRSPVDYRRSSSGKR